jgi:CheY-like chemotaxis protein
MNPSAPRILAADDSDEVLTYLADALAPLGGVFLKASDGEEAVSLAFRMQLDLIILDIDMPRLNGLEACRRLRELPFTVEVPVLFLTADSSEQTIQAAFEAGATDFLNKPVNALILMARVSNLLSLRKLTEELKSRSEGFK